MQSVALTLHTGVYKPTSEPTSSPSQAETESESESTASTTTHQYLRLKPQQQHQQH